MRLIIRFRKTLALLLAAVMLWSMAAWPPAAYADTGGGGAEDGKLNLSLETYRYEGTGDSVTLVKSSEFQQGEQLAVEILATDKRDPATSLSGFDVSIVFNTGEFDADSFKVGSSVTVGEATYTNLNTESFQLGEVFDQAGYTINVGEVIEEDETTRITFGVQGPPIPPVLPVLASEEVTLLTFSLAVHADVAPGSISLQLDETSTFGYHGEEPFDEVELHLADALRTLTVLPGPERMLLSVAADKETYYADDEVELHVSISGLRHAVPDGRVKSIGLTFDIGELDKSGYTEDLYGLGFNEIYLAEHITLSELAADSGFAVFEKQYPINDANKTKTQIMIVQNVEKALPVDEADDDVAFELFSFKLKVPEDAVWSTTQVHMDDFSIMMWAPESDGEPPLVEPDLEVDAALVSLRHAEVTRVDRPEPAVVSFITSEDGGEESVDFTAGDTVTVSMQVHGLQGIVSGPDVLLDLEAAVIYDKGLFTYVEDRFTTEFEALAPVVESLDESLNKMTFSVSGVTDAKLAEDDYVLLQFQLKVADHITTSTNTAISVASLVVTESPDQVLDEQLFRTVDADVTLHKALDAGNAFTGLSVDGKAGTFGEVNGQPAITVTLSEVRDLSNLIVAFTHTGIAVKIGEIPVSSGTAWDVSDPVVLTVVAENGDEAHYTLMVYNPPRLTSFSIQGIEASQTDLDQHQIDLIVPKGTDLTHLIAEFTILGSQITAGDHIAQISGITPNSFDQGPVLYTVLGEDGLTKVTYEVSVYALSSAKEIESFAIDGVAGVIDDTDKTIRVVLSKDTNLDHPHNITFALSADAAMRLGALEGSPMSGDGGDYNVKNALQLYVVAQDGSYEIYTLTVVPLSSAKDFISFAVNGHTGVISGEQIYVVVPDDMDLDHGTFPIDFAVSAGAVVLADHAEVESGDEFHLGSDLVLVVRAEDETIRTYTVSVIPAYMAVRIVSLSVGGHAGVIDHVKGTIRVTLPFGEELNQPRSLTFQTASHAVVKWETPTGATLISGVGAYDFNQPVRLFVIITENDLQQEYTLTVKIADPPPSAEHDILTFRVAGIPGTIDREQHTIAVELPHHYQLAGHPVAYSVSAHAAMSYEGHPVTSGSSAMYDFTNPQTFTVTAQNGASQSYTVYVTVALPPLSDTKRFTSFMLSGSDFDGTGVINEAAKKITVNVPYGTDVTALTPSFAYSGKSVYVGADLQQSGFHEISFQTPVTYTIYAEDGSHASYTVTVVIHAAPPTAPSYTPPYVPPSTPPVVNEDGETGNTEEDHEDGASGHEQAEGLQEVRFGNEARTAAMRNYVIAQANRVSGNEGNGALPVPSFSDIAGHWAEDNIKLLAGLNLMGGYPDRTFQPDAVITRAEFSTLVFRIFRLQAGTEPNSAFADTSEHWAEAAIAALQASGAISGYGDGTFRPNQEITRAEIVAILSRLVNLSDIATRKSFGDTTKHWAGDLIASFAGAGIIHGKTSNVFDPDAKATRAETIMILVNVLRLDPDIAAALNDLLAE